jgi:hypothetical protein
MCEDDVCKAEPSDPAPQEIWLIGSLELSGVTLAAFDIPDFAREAKKALEQAASRW